MVGGVSFAQLKELTNPNRQIPWWMQEDGIEKAAAACRRAGIPSLVIGGGAFQLSIVLGDDPNAKLDRVEPTDDRPTVGEQFAGSGTAPADDPGFAEE